MSCVAALVLYDLKKFLQCEIISKNTYCVGFSWFCGKLWQCFWKADGSKHGKKTSTYIGHRRKGEQGSTYDKIEWLNKKETVCDIRNVEENYWYSFKLSWVNWYHKKMADGVLTEIMNNNWYWVL